MSQCTEMYRRIYFTMYGNVPLKKISKVIWVCMGARDAISRQIHNKIGVRFHFRRHRRRIIYHFFSYVTDKVNGSRVLPSLFGEDQRPDPGDGGNRAYCFNGVSYSRAVELKSMLGLFPRKQKIA